MPATSSHWRSAVIDASGTWNSPDPLGADGLTGLEEAAAAANVFYGIPDVLGGQCARYDGKRVTVVGSGHSAFNALLEFAELSGQEPGTEITWRREAGQSGWRPGIRWQSRFRRRPFPETGQSATRSRLPQA